MAAVCRQKNVVLVLALQATRHRFGLALHIVTEVGEEWVAEDRKNGVEDGDVLYYERISPILTINENSPVGCYWIVANNNDGKKAMATADSYKIWIPGPTDLAATNFDDIDFEKVFIDNNENAELEVSLTNIPAHNSVVYQWFKKIDNQYVAQNLTSAAAQTISYEDEDLALADDMYKVECHSLRNTSHSNAILSKEFRVTDEAHKFIFDVEPINEAESRDGRRAIIRSYRDGEAALKFKIDFSENLDENEELNMVSDTVLYRFRQRIGSDVEGTPVYYNDSSVGGNGFIETTFDELKDLEFTIPSIGSYFYVEVINIVNEDFDIDALNDAADALAEEVNLTTTGAWLPYEERIARTPYIIVED